MTNILLQIILLVTKGGDGLKTIGERIKSRREELNLSQDELAKKLGYKSRSSINKIEMDSGNLTQSKIKAIADALETTPTYIMGWEDIDDSIDVEQLKNDVANAEAVMKWIIQEYGEKSWDDFNLYLQLDSEDRAEIRGAIKQLLRNDKYSIQKECKNA